MEETLNLTKEALISKDAVIKAQENSFKIETKKLSTDLNAAHQERDKLIEGKNFFCIYNVIIKANAPRNLSINFMQM